MAAAHHTARAEDLLFERERQGVRTQTIVRCIFMLIIVTTHWIVGVSLFEKVAATVVATLALIALCGFLFLLVRPNYVAMVGLSGCFIDIVMLSVLPVIWYLSVGGTSVPPAYMLKTQITVMTLGAVALNALAIRPPLSRRRCRGRDCCSLGPSCLRPERISHDRIFRLPGFGNGTGGQH